MDARRRHVLVAAVVALAASLAAMPALLQAKQPPMAMVEATMLVTGTVDVGSDGHVVGHALDQQEKLPPYVVSLVTRALPALRFEPVIEGGQPVQARAKMRMRLVARPGEGGRMQVAIRAVGFGEDATPDVEDARYKPADDDTAALRMARRTPPEYPGDVARIGGKGVVYLLLKIGPDGRPTEVAAEQVNLTAVGTEGEMSRIRGSLARASIEAARRWTFDVPTTGDMAGWPHWFVRVPVDFRFRGESDRGYGEWSAYHRGATTRPDWAPREEGAPSPDLIEPGEVYLAREKQKFRLLTPVGEG